jgi:4-amino-4-deoxy-L-arabinose transferase
MHTDHNDIAFLFYVTLSIWAWFEKESSEKKYWIFLIGLFAGMAILNKWLVGLLVYSIWGINTLLQKEKRNNLFSYLEITGSLVVTVIVALPWQIYIFNNFPLESKFEFEYNSLHFFQALEGHSGDYFYHLNKFESLFGTDFQYVFLVALVIFIFSKIKAKYKVSAASLIAIVYIFYSLAATKMPAFPIIVAPFIYLVVAVAVSFLLQLLKTTKVNDVIIKVVGLSLVFFMFFHFLNHDSLALRNKTANLKTYQNATTTTMVYKSLTTMFEDKDVMVYNSRNYDKLKIMFHTNYRARSGFPSKKSISVLRDNNIEIVVFDNNKLPGYILNDSTIAKIKSPVWQKKFEGDIELYY